MVKGLAIFQEWFKGFEDHDVLIGGTAATSKKKATPRSGLACAGFRSRKTTTFRTCWNCFRVCPTG